MQASTVSMAPTTRVKAPRGPKLSQREQNARAYLAASDRWIFGRRKPDGRPYFAMPSLSRPKRGEQPRVYGVDPTNCTCDYRVKHARGNDDACAHMLAVTRWYRRYRFGETRDHILPPDVETTWEGYDLALADRADALLAVVGQATQNAAETAVVDDFERWDVPDAPDSEEMPPEAPWWNDLGQVAPPVWLETGDTYGPDHDENPPDGFSSPVAHGDPTDV